MSLLEFLKTDRDFKNFKKSKSYSSKFLKIRVHYSLNQNIPRFGFIISKKTLPKVVDRNKVKRRIKAFLARRVAKIMPADILFFPQASALKQPFAQVSSEIEGLFTQAKLWKQ